MPALSTEINGMEWFSAWLFFMAPRFFIVPIHPSCHWTEEQSGFLFLVRPVQTAISNFKFTNLQQPENCSIQTRANEYTLTESASSTSTEITDFSRLTRHAIFTAWSQARDSLVYRDRVWRHCQTGETYTALFRHAITWIQPSRAKS